MIRPTSASFVKIYFWSVISIAVGFISMLVVIPHLTSNPELFGIYSVCLSITLYLSYADIGFLLAGQKFAAEEYAKNNLNEEISITGFSIFILIFMFIPFSIFSVYLANNPEILLGSFSSENRDVARKLLLIVGLLLPIQIILERLTSFILQIRLKDFIAIRISLLINFIKIVSIFYFFGNNQYLLTEYFLFITLISIFGSLLVLIFIRVSLSYDFVQLIKNTRFKFSVCRKIGLLGFSSFFFTISYIIYFEIDNILIAKLIGVKEVAYYAVGFTLLTFVKRIINLFYSPFMHWLNQLAGLGDKDSISRVLRKILELSLPAYLISVLVLFLSVEYIIGFWVGVGFDATVRATELLFISLLFNAYNWPARCYYNTALRYSYMYIIAILAPIVFITSIFILHDEFGIEAFAWSKIIVGAFISLVAIIGLREIIHTGKPLMYAIVPLILVLAVILWLYPLYLTQVFPTVEKNIKDLFLLLFSALIIILVSYFLVIGSSFRRQQDVRALFAHD